MRFTDGKLSAIEALMSETPGFNHFDSGSDGKYLECRSCRFHLPASRYCGCKYETCPYLMSGTFPAKKGGGCNGDLPR